jgi:hypothetical protein
MGGDKYSWDGNSVSNLLQNRSSGSKSGRRDLLTDVVVDYYGSNGVEDDFEGLQHDQSLGEILRFLHLSEQTEESHVGAVGKNDVGDGAEGLDEIGVDSSPEVLTTLVLHTDRDHSDDDSSYDTGEGYKWQLAMVVPSPGEVRVVHTHARDIGHVLHSTGQRADETDDESDSRENHRASSVFGNGVHHDTESQDVRTHNENREE